MRRLVACLALTLGVASCVRDRAPPIPMLYDATYTDAQWDITYLDLQWDRSDNGQPGECGGTIRTLSQSRAEILLVVDRSGSMNDPDTSGLSKWDSMRSAFARVLPGIQSWAALGLLAFPMPQPADVNPPITTSCGLAGALDVEPRFNNAGDVLLALSRRGPGGATPTHDALRAAGEYFAGNTDPLGRRFLILATDGAPNCNGTLPRGSCRCTGLQTSCSDPRSIDGAYLCLDDQRTIARLNTLRNDGIPTFVIGLPGAEMFSDVLDAMAVAGGRPRAAAQRFYSAATATEIQGALNAITTQLTDCRFELPEAPVDPNEVDVRLGRQRLGRDTTHRNGWDWEEGSNNTVIVFYGSTCNLVQSASGGTALVAAFGCPPAPAPE